MVAKIFLLSAIVVGLVCACARAPAPTQRSAVPADVIGQVWQLETMGGNPLLADTQITLEFDRGQGGVAGNAGCNHYQGQFSGSLSRLEFSHFALSKKLCLQPDGVMDQEKRFLNHLQAVQAALIKGSKLVLNHPQSALIFAPLIP